MRLINNAIPNFARDDLWDVNLSPEQADLLVAHQLAGPHPRFLDEASFFVARIVDARALSAKVHKALVKNGIILQVPGGQPRRSACVAAVTVNTGAITKSFAHQLACISVHAQRKLVGMLFFWEEECHRHAKLARDEQDIVQQLREVQDAAAATGPPSTETGDVTALLADLQLALGAVRMRKTLLPSRRAEATPNVAPGRGHELPVYA